MEDVFYSSILTGLITFGIVGFLSSYLYRKFSTRYQKLAFQIIDKLSRISFMVVVFEPIGYIIYLQQNYISEEMINFSIVIWFICFYVISAPLMWLNNLSELKVLQKK